MSRAPVLVNHLRSAINPEPVGGTHSDNLLPRDPASGRCAGRPAERPPRSRPSSSAPRSVKTSPPTRYSNTSTCAVPLFSHTDATNEGGSGGRRRPRVRPRHGAHVGGRDIRREKLLDPRVATTVFTNVPAVSFADRPRVVAVATAVAASSASATSGSTATTRVGDADGGPAEGVKASRSPTSSRCPRPSTDSHPPEDDDFPPSARRRGGGEPLGRRRSLRRGVPP